MSNPEITDIGPGYTVREPVEDYEALLVQEGLGIIPPQRGEELVIGGVHNRFGELGAIENVTEAVAVAQLLETTGLTQRQYDVIARLATMNGATISSVAKDLKTSTTMVRSHRRGARKRLERLGASPTAMFEVDPTKKRKPPETLEETDKLHAGIDANYRHLHEEEDGATRKRILERMIRSTAKEFVMRDPTIKEVITVQELLKDYWSFQLFGAVARSVHSPSLKTRVYEERIREETVRRSVAYLKQYMTTGNRPESDNLSPQRNDPNQPRARHWYDTSDIRPTASEKEPDRPVVIPPPLTPPAPAVTEATRSSNIGRGRGIGEKLLWLLPRRRRRASGQTKRF